MYTKDLYLNLMKKCLTNYIYGDTEYEFINKKCSWIESFLGMKSVVEGEYIIKYKAFDIEKRENGLDWPITAHTMVGLKRLDNIQYCFENIVKDNIAGDLIETGVWRGGASIFMRALLKAYNITDRMVWVADSFRGLPAPNEHDYPDDKGDIHYTIKELSISQDQVKDNFSKYDLLDGQVRFLEGWFKDTLPSAPIKQLSILRLDGDMYESTIDALVNLYSKVSIGGYIIVDDYCLGPCKKAIHDYRNEKGIKDEIVNIDGIGAFWRKTS